MTEMMRGLVVRENPDMAAPPSARLELVEKPVPTPGPGEVLVKMEAASANPSDLYYLSGEYGVPPVYGGVGGFEGSGRVVATGGGITARFLKGKRVACASAGGEGTWAEYMVAPANTCLPIDDRIPLEQSATLVVNPFTAYALLDRAEALGAKAVIQNAAASQVGKLVIRLAQRRGMPIISTVRRTEQAEALKSIGAEHVLITTEDGFVKDLKKKAKELDARVFFDAVAGVDTARVLSVMPSRSTAIVYGLLDRNPEDPYGGRYPVAGMIFEGKQIEGFWLSTALPALGPMKILKRAKELGGLFAEGALSTDVAGTYSLEDYPAALDDYAQAMSAGKRILRFD